MKSTLRSGRLRRAKRIQSRQPGHHQIRDHQVARRVPLDDRQRRTAIFHLRNNTPHLIETLGNDPADVGVIIDNEDVSSFRRACRPRRAHGRCRGLVGAGQIDLHRGPLTQATANPYRAAGLFYDTEYHRQAQPRPLADFLRGKERFERALQNFGAHPGSGVSHRDQHAVSARDLCRQFLTRRGDVCRFDQHHATTRHGIARVEDDVEERRLDLRGIDQNRPEVGRQSMPDLDGRAEGAAQNLAHLDNDGVEVGRDRGEQLLAAEGEQRFSEFGALGGPALRGMDQPQAPTSHSRFSTRRLTSCLICVR